MQTAVQTEQQKVVEVDPLTDPRYDAYVRSSHHGLPYHLGAWARILRGAYGFTPAYLALVRGRDVVGVLPLMYTRGLILGRRLRSLPVVPACGALGDTVGDELALLDAACRLTEQRRAALTFTARSRQYERDLPNLHGTDQHPTWITPLQADPDHMRREWKKRSSNLHRSIVKAERAGVTVREASAERDVLAFYRLYLETMKRHRVLPRAWRQVALDTRLLGPEGVTRVFVAEHRGEIVAGGLFHVFNGTVELLYNGSDEAARDVRPNFALYWHVIRWGVEAGCEQFDWGSGEPGSGLARFKAQWSAEPVAQCRYDYRPHGGGDGAARADRLRNRQDHLDAVRQGQAEPGIGARLTDMAWERAPLGLLRAGGAAVYRLL